MTQEQGGNVSSRPPLDARPTTLGLEWLFRLSQEPRRLWKRYLTTNAQFIFLVANGLRRARRRALKHP